MNQLLDDYIVELNNAIALKKQIAEQQEEIESNLRQAQEEYEEWYEGQFQQNQEAQGDAIANEWVRNFTCNYPSF